jgi:hypothetical protein
MYKRAANLLKKLALAGAARTTGGWWPAATASCPPPPRARALQARRPDALAVEMEGAAVAQVCHDYGVPFAAVRTISDRADDAAARGLSAIS